MENRQEKSVQQNMIYNTVGSLVYLSLIHI